MTRTFGRLGEKVRGFSAVRNDALGPGCVKTSFLPCFALSSMDLKRTMAINVRRERHTRKLTQEELADRAGLSARYLGSIERAKVSASVTVLGRLAQALRIDACDLICPPSR